MKKNLKVRLPFLGLLAAALLFSAVSDRVGYAVVGGGFFAHDAVRGIGNLQTNIVDVYDSTTGYKVRLTTGVLSDNAELALSGGGGVGGVTGPVSVAQGDVLYASGTNALAALTKSASATRYLSNTGSSNNPAWAKIDENDGITFNRASIERSVAWKPKVGATSGFVVNAADNISLATLAASNSGSTLVIPVDDLHTGDTITAFKLNGAYTSDGSNVMVDCALRSQTPAAAGTVTDALVSAATQLVGTSNPGAVIALTKSSISATVTTGVSYYLLITVTTPAACTVKLVGASITVTNS